MSGSTRSYEIAKYLVMSGHNVTVITAASHTNSRIRNYNIDGIDVVSLNVAYDHKFSFTRRIFSFLLFSVQATFYSYIKKPDLIYASSTPLTVAFPALFLKFIQKVPYIFEVRDMWPDVPIAIGVIKNSFIKYLLLN